jgi:hypothetical protein
MTDSRARVSRWPCCQRPSFYRGTNSYPFDANQMIDLADSADVDPSQPTCCAVVPCIDAFDVLTMLCIAVLAVVLLTAGASTPCKLSPLIRFSILTQPVSAWASFDMTVPKALTNLEQYFYAQVAANFGTPAQIIPLTVDLSSGLLAAFSEDCDLCGGSTFFDQTASSTFQVRESFSFASAFTWLSFCFVGCLTCFSSELSNQYFPSSVLSAECLSSGLLPTERCARLHVCRILFVRLAVYRIRFVCCSVAVECFFICCDPFT